MKQFFKQLWCAMRGHDETEISTMMHMDMRVCECPRCEKMWDEWT